MRGEGETAPRALDTLMASLDGDGFSRARRAGAVAPGAAAGDAGDAGDRWGPLGKGMWRIAGDGMSVT